MPIVYMITNRNNGKSYIGMTSRTLESRFNSHLSAVRQGSKFRLHSAIRKYGIDCWDKTILAENDDIATIRSIEEQKIAEYKTMDFGYNAKPGGCGGWIVLKEKYEAWHNKIRKRNIGVGNGNYSGITNEELFDMVFEESKKLNRVPPHKHMIRAYKKFPKSFTKFRFEGKYANLAKMVADQLGMIYNPYFRTDEHCQKLRAANLGKLGSNKNTRVETKDGKRIHVKY
jgi:hypothetical protein